MRMKKGFTFVETIMVIGIIAILFSLSVPQLFRMQDRNTLQTSLTKLISLIRQQQLHAMNAPKQYGIYLEQSKYTLFDGPIYSNTDPTNTINVLDYPLQFTLVKFPSSQIIFASGSGEIVSFDTNNHSFILEDMLNQDKRTVQFNELGVPTQMK